LKNTDRLRSKPFFNSLLERARTEARKQSKSDSFSAHRNPDQREFPVKALTLNAIKEPLVFEDRASLQPGPQEVVVQVQAAALNRRDYWITQGQYPGIKPPVVLGSDASGVVSACGEGVSESWIGQDVVIDPGSGWGADPLAQSPDFRLLGAPLDGTFATEVKVAASQLHPKPAHLDWLQAAALPLAGVTAWRALFTQGGLQPGDTVLITGIGGGVATFALQFAVAAGANVWVTSSSEDKLKRATAMGARGGFNYRLENWATDMVHEAGHPTLIIDSAGGPGYASLVNAAAPGGRIVNYGATTGAPPTLDLFKVFWKQLRLQGSTMGSPSDFVAMLKFVGQHQLSPVIDQTFPLSEGNAAISLMQSSPQFGKIVLSVQ